MFIFPNPADNIANIRYKIANDGFVNISLYDILGEKVVDFVGKYLLKGVYNSEINLSLIPSGVYMCKMVLNGRIVVIRKLVISK